MQGHDDFTSSLVTTLKQDFRSTETSRACAVGLRGWPLFTQLFGFTSIHPMQDVILTVCPFLGIRPFLMAIGFSVSLPSASS